MRENFSRFKMIGIILAILGVLVTLQLVRVQVSGSAKKLEVDNSLMYSKGDWTNEPERGSIYDRWGHLLAGNLEVYEVGVDMMEMDNPQAIATTLSTLTTAKYSDIMGLINAAQTKNLRYIRLVDFVPPERYQDLLNVVTQFQKEGKQDLNGLQMRAHLMRYYPEKTLASNVLGFYPFKQQESADPTLGLEGNYNSRLKGSTQQFTMSYVPYGINGLPPVPTGTSLVTTIDRPVQAAVEETLTNAIKDTGSTSGTIIVMDPRNGEIWGMASSPEMDLNQYDSQYMDLYGNNPYFNRAVMQLYEPGSVFKILTMAAALDAGAVTPETTYYDKGWIEIGGQTFHNWDYGAYGEQNMVGCMQHSLNVCLAWVAYDKLGPTKFYQYIQDFGIGRRTHIDLSSEANYPLRLPEDKGYTDATLATNSFGQGVSVTPIQILQAVAAVANNGKMVMPHVVKATIDNGKRVDVPVRVVGQPIKPETAQTLNQMLAASLENEASSALVEGYRVAGKTGTASIPGPDGKYLDNATNASFVGWGPVDDPRFIIYIWLERPTKSQWGSVVAAPIFSDLFKKVAILTNLPPDAVRLALNNGQ